MSIVAFCFLGACQFKCLSKIFAGSGSRDVLIASRKNMTSVCEHIKISLEFYSSSSTNAESSSPSLPYQLTHVFSHVFTVTVHRTHVFRGLPARHISSLPISSLPGPRKVLTIKVCVLSEKEKYRVLPVNIPHHHEVFCNACRPFCCCICLSLFSQLGHRLR